MVDIMVAKGDLVELVERYLIWLHYRAIAYCDYAFEIMY